MSFWTYLNGNITVEPLGRTQAEKRYILETVLDHLPLVTGSEGDMDAYIIQKNGFTSGSSHTEFGEWGGYRKWNTLSTQTQDEYILVVDGKFRDRLYGTTYMEFEKWLTRLAKRVYIKSVLVEIEGQGKSSVIRNDTIPGSDTGETLYGQMYENPSWCGTGKSGTEGNWCEYLMWKAPDESGEGRDS